MDQVKVLIYMAAVVSHLTLMATVKVYNFETTLTAAQDDNKTGATLTESIEKIIDEVAFVFCFSFKVGKIDYTGPLEIRDENDDQWLYFMLTPDQDGLLYGIFGASGSNEWYTIAKAKDQLNHWYHLCMDFDFENDKITVALNGELTAELEGVTAMTNASPSKIVIGKTMDYAREENQYAWQLTNLQLFSSPPTPSLQELSLDLCGQIGDLLAWDQMTWQREGNWSLVREDQLEPGTVCANKDTQDVALNMGINQKDGVKACYKMGKGVMTAAPKTPEELKSFLDWFEENDGGGDDRCYNIWTPLSDEEEEGVWRSLVDGSNATFLPCAPNFCEEENRARNSMVLYIPDGPVAFADVEGFQGNCISCTLNSSLTFSLLGLCSDSIMGEIYVPIYFRLLQ